MKKVQKFIRTYLLNIMAILTIGLGIFSIYENANAAEIWCPPCESDAAKESGCDFLYWIGGRCYCCIELE